MVLLCYDNTMIVKRIEIPHISLKDVLEPMLLGRVFHVTATSVAESVLAGERLLTNESGALESGFGSSRNGFFRKRGCISLFDFRAPTEDGLEKAYDWANALNPNGNAKGAPAFLFLSEDHHEKLIPWTLWKEENAHTQMIVPYVECGYPGQISANMISEVIFVKIITSPDPFERLA